LRAEGVFVVVYNYMVPIDKTKRYIVLEYRDAKDPRRWMEINRFRDRQHYNEVIAAVDGDPRLGPLFEEFISLFDAEEYRPEKRTYFRMI